MRCNFFLSVVKYAEMQCAPNKDGIFESLTFINKQPEELIEKINLKGMALSKSKKGSKIKEGLIET